jgi:hypothetical protein
MLVHGPQILTKAGTAALRVRQTGDYPRKDRR